MRQHILYSATVLGLMLASFSVGIIGFAAFDAMNAIKLEPVVEPSPLILHQIVYLPRPEVMRIAERICQGHNGYAGIMSWKYVPTQVEIFCNDHSLWGSDGVQIYAAEKSTAVKP